MRFKPGPDIAEWLDDLSARIGQGRDLIINTSLREYIKSHTREEIESHMREAGETRGEWPEKEPVRAQRPR